MKKLLTLIFIIIFSQSLFASNNAGMFMENGIGARAAGLGNSYTALVDDSNAVYWNPAALTHIKSTEFNTMMYNGWETDYFSFTLAAPVSFLYLGFGYLNASVGDIIYSQSALANGRYQNEGAFSYSASAVYLSGATTFFIDNLAIGATFKYIFETLYQNNATGMCADAGISYRPFDFLNIGINAQNIWSTGLKWDTDSKNKDKIPLNIKGGALISLFNSQLNISTDVNYRKNRDLKWNLGLEYWLAPQLALRFGFNPMQAVNTKLNGIFQSVGMGI
ncbi:PorV/PorQ family protein, partial [Candidatus Margulisiibacteriota bacterium]